MELKAFMDTLPRGGQKQFAVKCGISPAYLYQISTGRRACSEKLAIAIERESKAVVVCEELRPDVDWAYLRGSDVGHVHHRIDGDRRDHERRKEG